MEGIEVIINIFAQMISAFWADHLPVIGSFARDIAVAVSAVWAVWAGQKGLRKYLYDEDLKERAKRVRSANEVAHHEARKVLEDIESTDTNTRPVTEDDLDAYRNWAEKLNRATRGSSSSVQTYAFFLRQFLSVVKPNYKSQYGASESIVTLDLLNLVYAIAHMIAHEAAHIVDVPDYPELKKNLSKGKGAYRVVPKHTSVRFPGGRYGLDLNPQSEPAHEFYSAVVAVTSSRVLRKECLRIIRSNLPVVQKLFRYGIYFPPRLDVDRTLGPNSLPILFSGQLYLIGLKRDFVAAEKQSGYVWKAWYAELGGGIKFTNTSEWLSHIGKNYFDLVNDSQEFNKNFQKATVYAGEIIEVPVPESEVKKLSLLRKWALKKWLGKLGVPTKG